MRRLLSLFLLLAACAPPAAAPAEGAARRVVSLLPSFTEILVELEAADRLVGCTEYCKPGREVARLAWRGAAAAEQILRLEPDLVLRQTPRREPDELRLALEAVGVRVLSLPSETIDDVRGAILGIGRAVGRRGEAMRFRDGFDEALVRARAGAVGKPAPKVLFVLSRDAGRVANVTAAGPGTFLDELIRYAGGRNVLAEMAQPYPTVSLETVFRLEPEVVIDNLPSEADFRAAWAPLDALPAVRDGRLRAVLDNGLLIPGPHLPRAVERMVEMIHGRS